MYRYFRPILFQLDPEFAHSLTLSLIRLIGVIPGLRAAIHAYFRTSKVPVQAFGLTFSNPIGLAAGYDKDGTGWRGLYLLGFGHIELGTVTPQPQIGNSRPRIFRLQEEQALINHMGFPSRGCDFLASSLAMGRPSDLILGINLGKNEATPLDNAIDDYRILLKRFASLADYLVINISSPNTPGLRSLQSRYTLNELLSELGKTRRTEMAKINRQIPLLLKLSPDLSEDELDDVVDVALGNGIDGVVATNTTISREGLRSKYARQLGGLSGKPLLARSTELVSRIYKRAGDQLPIIGVGGVMNVDDAKEKIEAGARLIQVYTGLVFNGPGLVKDLVKGLAT